MSAFVFLLLAVLALVLTILLCVKVIPEKFNGTFTKKPLQFLHNYFNFKNLYLESVLKFLFTLCTVACVVGGLGMATVVNVIDVIECVARWIKYDYYSFGYILRTFFVNLFGGAAVAVVGPIALRLAYEGVLMFILLVKNVIDINKKLDK